MNFGKGNIERQYSIDLGEERESRVIEETLVQRDL